MRKKELLAPAGDIEAGYAALFYGADAVYLGLPKFSARATAVNFDEDNLDQFTAYAHHLNRKVYVTINTVIQEDELSDLIQSLDTCSRCKVDGLIIQDLGVARIIKEQYPWFEMHASTQMAVHNKEGALFLKKLGFKRVVVARELTLREIKDIAAIPDLEIEAFIHGALCYSYSGLCQFSAVEYGRSANRGKCIYPCRAQFEYEGQKTHLFSMKDMALQKEVLQMPVDSLKIEGRKKSALYVAAVTNYYRHILDGKDANKHLEDDIKQIFSRPWCQFHFYGQNKTIIDRDFVGHRGLLIGTVEGVYKQQIVFCPSHKIARYDGLQIDCQDFEKPYGFSIQKMFVDRKSVYEADAGQKVWVELPKGYPNIQVGSAVYLASSSQVKGKYKYEKPKDNLYRNNNNINVKVNVKDDMITASFNQYSACVKGQFLPAKDLKNCDQAVYEAFTKTGNTKLSLQTIEIDNPKHLFTPKSLLNCLRRDLYGQIEFEAQVGQLPSVSEANSTESRWTIKLDCTEFLKEIDPENFAEIIILISPKTPIEMFEKLPKDKVRIALPAVCRKPQKYRDIIAELLARGYKKWEVANYWGFEILSFEGLDISLDSSLYMLNSQAMEMARKLGATGITFAIEDTKLNIEKLIEKADIRKTLTVFQYVPLFISVGCVRENDCQICPKGELWLDLKRNGREYKALSRDCQMMIFDKNAFCIAEEAKNMRPDFKRIDLTYFKLDAEKVRNIINVILSDNNITNCIKSNFCAKNI